MTCIVGLVNNGKVYIGGDSAEIAGYNLRIRADEKVFKNGPFIMGFTTSFRMGQLLRYKFEPPKHLFDDDGKLIDTYKFMATTFIDSVRKCLKDGGYAQKDKDQEWGGTFLVGYRDRLFIIEDDYQVGESVDKYDTVGCGQQIALGSLDATGMANRFGNFKQSPKERVEIALSAAEKYSAGVRGPFVVLNN